MPPVRLGVPAAARGVSSRLLLLDDSQSLLILSQFNPRFELHSLLGGHGGEEAALLHLLFEEVVVVVLRPLGRQNSVDFTIRRSRIRPRSMWSGKSGVELEPELNGRERKVILLANEHANEVVGFLGLPKPQNITNYK